MEVKLKEIQYRQDVLGAGYECADLEFQADYEGKVIATLIRKKAQKSTHKAVLYIHGFIDYFFQTEMAEKFNEQGFDFYALDLRKYGSTRHAGFGLGFERCVMYLTGMANIRDVIPFPRTVNNCEL